MQQATARCVALCARARVRLLASISLPTVRILLKFYVGILEEELDISFLKMGFKKGHSPVD
jgi:hypothetical protein